MKELMLYRLGKKYHIDEKKIIKKIQYVWECCAEKEHLSNEEKKKIKKCYTKSLSDLIVYATEKKWNGNLWHYYLTDILIQSENPFSKFYERKNIHFQKNDSSGISSISNNATQKHSVIQFDDTHYGNFVDNSLSILAKKDLEVFQQLFSIDFNRIDNYVQTDIGDMITNFQWDISSAKEKTVLRREIEQLVQSLANSSTINEMYSDLLNFYQKYGVGNFGLNQVFRIKNDKNNNIEIFPIKNTSNIIFSELVGYEIQKQKLIENTKNFVQGKKANNVLLFGESGTGKSSCIKCISNEFAKQGLRIIEVYKHQIQDFHKIIENVKDRNYKFIIYMDDLSFEEFEIEYKYLKAIIEGGLEEQPDNVLIYATSNRRHLIRESFQDTKDFDMELHKSDTVEEKLSLASRFGVSIYFGAPTKKEFQEIVRHLAKRENIHIEEKKLFLEANQWELAHGGLTGRSANQFITYIKGKFS